MIYENDGKHKPEPYKILAEVRKEWHSDLAEAKIALAWRKNLKHDVDGHLKLGMCVKVSELYNKFSEFDFIIVLNKEVWEDPDFTREKKLALVDHELCHAAPALDKDFERKQDELGRYLWRTRKHDIEEFTAIVQRHGCYKRDLERFAEALLKKRATPLLQVIEKVAEDINAGALNTDKVKVTAEVH